MSARGRRWLSSPMVQFLAVGILALLAILAATSVLGTRAAEREALEDARNTTELLARSVAEPAVPRGLVDGDAGAIDRFDRAATARLVVGDVRRIKIWAQDGTIVYSDDVRLIDEALHAGRRRAGDPAQRRFGRRRLRPDRAREPLRAGRGRPRRGLHPDHLARG